MGSNQCIICGYNDYENNGLWNGWPINKCKKCGVNYLIRKSSKKIIKIIQMIKYYKNWAIALLDRIHILDMKPIIYRLKSGVNFLVYTQTHDVQVINEIWIDKIYSPWEGGIQSDWIVVDFGGHRGVFTIYAAQLAKSVHTIEANPFAASILRTNIFMNKVNNKVSLSEGAIACREGITDFFVATDAGMSGLIKRKSVEVDQQIKVAKISVKKFFKDFVKVNLLKVDIEGSEFVIFDIDCVKEWLNKIERIAMEYHDNPKPIYDTLKYFGYHVILWPERNILYAEHPSILNIKE